VVRETGRSYGEKLTTEAQRTQRDVETIKLRPFQIDAIEAFGKANSGILAMATPIRPYDEEGTEVILDYFGGIVYEFSLEDAIAEGILCQYDYHVYVAALTDEEHEKFQQLTAKIASLLNKDDRDRKTILANFAKGYLDALVAVKCLDEGVDIPSVHQAIILASDATERHYSE
jgi:superfamily II DNA or RNA helicase